MNALKLTTSLVLVLAGVLITSYVALAVSQGYGEESGYFANRTFLDAQSASATSTGVRVGGAEAITFLFHSDGPNGEGVGTTTFSVEGSVDGTNFYDYNMLISNATNANSEQLTRVATVELTGTTSALYYMDLTKTPFQSVRCITVEAGTTIATCDAHIQY